ncbi:acyl-CoA dehydrogenase C-terminal domain-containing protein [Gluconacetobacter sacchari]
MATARFFAERVLPQARGLAAQIGAGAGAIMAPDADWF